jgi:hypothetical protein
VIDDQTLVEAFQKARRADRMRVPAMSAILARAEYAREMQKRRRFTAAVTFASALAGAVSLCLIILAPGAFPLPMSPAIVPLLALGGAAALWGFGPARRPSSI